MAEWLDTLSFFNLTVSLKNYVGGVPLLYLQYIMGSDEYTPIFAYSARTAHPFQRNGAPFRFRLSKAQQVY